VNGQGSSGSSDKRESSQASDQDFPEHSSKGLPCKVTGTCTEDDSFSRTIDYGEPEEEEEDEDLQEYATDLRLTAGCVVDPPDMTVANAHQNESLCERILATPMMDQDGDFFEVAAKFSWTVSSYGPLAIKCLNGPDDNLCWPVASQDIFDDPKDAEPTALVTACAINQCPEPQPQDCKDAICKSVTVKVAVNIEGPWVFMGATLDPNTPASISQSGRWFEDQAIGIKDGLVQGKSVKFQYGDYAYTGVIQDHGQAMSGTVTDLITSNYTGTWWAVRQL
jgi:hypothetical protein